MTDTGREIGDATSSRVFCIGMNKTGTSTMKACFEILAIVPVACPSGPHGRQLWRLFHRIVKKGDYAAAVRFAQRFAAFEDRPWNVWDIYKHVARTYPTSKFILTVREPESWWDSVERWLSAAKPEMVPTYIAHLQARDFSRGAFIDSYSRYNDGVRTFFSSQDNLLVMDVCAGAGWAELCPFLGAAIPREAFPHENRRL